MIGTGLTLYNRSQEGGDGYLLFALFYCIQTGIDEPKCDKEGTLGKESYQNQVCVYEIVFVCIYCNICNNILYNYNYMVEYFWLFPILLHIFNNTLNNCKIYHHMYLIIHIIHYYIHCTYAYFTYIAYIAYMYILLHTLHMCIYYYMYCTVSSHFDLKWPSLMKRLLKDLSPLNFSFSQQWLDMMWPRVHEVGTFLYLWAALSWQLQHQVLRSYGKSELSVRHNFT